MAPCGSYMNLLFSWIPRLGDVTLGGILCSIASGSAGCFGRNCRKEDSFNPHPVLDVSPSWAMSLLFTICTSPATKHLSTLSSTARSFLTKRHTELKFEALFKFTLIQHDAGGSEQNSFFSFNGADGFYSFYGADEFYGASSGDLYGFYGTGEFYGNVDDTGYTYDVYTETRSDSFYRWHARTIHPAVNHPLSPFYYFIFLK
eukprot:204134-Prorocentrum_minimum.AAC.2